MIDNHCANCLFSQRVMDRAGHSRLICRNVKVGPHLAKTKLSWFLDEETKKAPCPEFYTKRDIPKDSPIRALIGPGAARLAKIVSDQVAENKLSMKADQRSQQNLF